LVTQIGEEGTSVCGIQPFTFVASDTISADSVIVELKAWPTPSCGGVASSIISGVKGEKDTLPEGTGSMPAGLMMKMQSSKSEIGITGSTPVTPKERITTCSMEKLRKRLYAIREKAKNKSQFDRIIEKIEARLAGINRVTKNTTITSKPLANIGQIVMSYFCELPIAHVTIEKECVQPLSVPRCSEPRTEVPNIIVTERKNGFADETVNCGTDKLEIFKPSDKKFFTPYEDKIEVCFDDNTKSWRYNLPEVEVNVILDECSDNIAPYAKLELINDVKFIPDKCCAWRDFKGQLNKYPITTRRKGYLIFEAVQLHEQVHKADFLEDVEKEKRKVLEALLKGLNPSCEEYPTFEAGKNKIEEQIKGVFDLFESEVKKDWNSRAQDSNYELKTQSNKIVEDKVNEYIKALGLGPTGCPGDIICP
jgi:hypothetical protein